MRVSVNKNDPGYAEYEKRCLNDSQDILITLGGKLCSSVTTADSVRGYVVVLWKDEEGSNIREVDGEPRTRCLHGQVSIYFGLTAKIVRWWKTRCQK